MPKPLPYGLLIALFVYAFTASTYHQEMGIVGEVSIGWTKSPKVLTSADPDVWTDPTFGPSEGASWGPFVASQSRPIERLGRTGPPLAINQHTGGLSDWPSWLLHAIGFGPATIQLFHFLLGAGILITCYRFLSIHASKSAANACALILACDWSFLFYKSALGGTEICLQAGLLLCLWGVWSRRWGGGKHGFWPIAIGIGIGLQAKLTFALPMIALAISLYGMRWDKPKMNPPLAKQIVGPFLFAFAAFLPLVIAWTHHLSLERTFISHDFAHLQFDRVLNATSGGETPARESWLNLWHWLMGPLNFFKSAYDVDIESQTNSIKYLAWFLSLWGALLAWKNRSASSGEALLRLLSPLLILAMVFIAWIARDLHHFAMLTPVMAIWFALSIDQFASHFAPKRSFRRSALCFTMSIPLICANAADAVNTPTVINAVGTPTFSKEKQRELVAILKQEKVNALTTMDYEIYGVLESLMPNLEIQHTWPLISKKHIRALPSVLTASIGGHLISVQASAPMSYNLRPTRKEIKAAAERLGLSVEEIGSWSQQSIILWKVSK